MHAIQSRSGSLGTFNHKRRVSSASEASYKTARGT
jgi:hypothetical protein